MLLGAGVAYVRPDLGSARLLLVFSVGLATFVASDLWHWTQASARMADLVDQQAGSAMSVAAAALLQLFVTLGSTSRLTRRWVLSWSLVYTVAVLPLGLALVGVQMWPLTFLLMALLLLGAAAALEVRVRDEPALVRAQLGWIRWAVYIGVAATVLRLLAVVAIPDHIPAAVGAAVVPLAWLPFPVALAFAVLRYRLFDVDRVVRTTLTWAILAAGMLVAYLGLVFLASRLVASVLAQATTSTDPTMAIVAALAIAVAAYPMRARLQRALDRHIYRRRLGREQVYAEAVDLLGQPQSAGVVARFICHRVPSVLGLSRAWLAVPQEHASTLVGPDVTLASTRLLDAVHKEGANAVLLDTAADDHNVYAGLPTLRAAAPDLQAWHAAGARLLVPMRGTTGQLLGVWVLGEPNGGELFEREDLTLMQRMAVLAGIQLERMSVAASPRPARVDTDALAPLTPREREVALLVARGLTNVESVKSWSSANAQPRGTSSASARSSAYARARRWLRG
jgi:hypothetical protein